MGPNGKIVRECHASQECIDKKVSYERRCLLIRHLKNAHHLTEVIVPEHRLGRPKASERPPRPVSPRCKRQCMARSMSVEHRVKVARRKFYDNLPQKAVKEWDRLFDKKGRTFEMWGPDWIENEKTKWEADMPKRVAKMEKSIAGGYKERKKVDDISEDEEEDDIEDVSSSVSGHVRCLIS